MESTEETEDLDAEAIEVLRPKAMERMRLASVHRAAAQLARKKADELVAQADADDAAAARLEEQANDLLRVLEGIAQGVIVAESESDSRGDKVRRLFARFPDRVFSVDDVRIALREPRESTDSVRSTLATMARQGDIERRGRGAYGLKKHEP